MEIGKAQPTGVQTFAAKPTVAAHKPRKPDESHLDHLTALYTVKPGENMSQIARRFGQEVFGHDGIAFANSHIPDPNVLYPGDQLIIPLWFPYVVGKGETLSSIGQTYGVSPKVLARANGLGDGNVIHPGQTVLVPQALEEK